MIFTGQPGTRDALLAAVEPGAVPALRATDAASAADAGSAARVRLVFGAVTAPNLTGRANTTPALTGGVGTAVALTGSTGTGLAAGGAAGGGAGLAGSVGTAVALGGSSGAAAAAGGGAGTAVALGGSVGTAVPLGAAAAGAACVGRANTQLLLGGSPCMATIANISFYKGEDVTLTVTMSPATNITGWNLQFTVRKSFGDTTALISKTTGAGITITDATNGVFTVSVASADTTGLDLRAYVFDIQRTDSGHRTVLTIGNLTLLPEVTL